MQVQGGVVQWWAPLLLSMEVLGSSLSVGWLQHSCAAFLPVPSDDLPVPVWIPLQKRAATLNCPCEYARLFIYALACDRLENSPGCTLSLTWSQPGLTPPSKVVWWMGREVFVARLLNKFSVMHALWWLIDFTLIVLLDNLLQAVRHGKNLESLSWTCISKVNVMSVQVFWAAGHHTPSFSQ